MLKQIFGRRKRGGSAIRTQLAVLGLSALANGVRRRFGRDRHRPGPIRRTARAGLPVGAVLLGVVGGYVAYRQTRRDPNSKGIDVEATTTINRPPNEVYAFWRELTTLPRFMDHLKEVTLLDANRSHWVAKGPVGIDVAWDAQITDDTPNERIAWCSVEGADVANAGEVQFRAAPGGRGTEVRVRLEYYPPAGKLGAAVAKLFGEEPAQQVRGDLRRLKQLMEAGETPATRGQSSSRGTLHRTVTGEGASSEGKQTKDDTVTQEDVSKALKKSMPDQRKN